MHGALGTITFIKALEKPHSALPLFITRLAKEKMKFTGRCDIYTLS